MSGLPLTAARRLLEHYGDRLPDLSDVVVLVPNLRAGQAFARILAREAGRPALVPPTITPLKAWAETVATGNPEPEALRLARLHAALRRADWLGTVDRWALAAELLQLADALSAVRLGDEVATRLRALHGEALDRETALVETVWRILNGDGRDPQARYAAALDVLAAGHAAHPRPIFGYALGPLTGVERAFLGRLAERAPLHLVECDPADPVAHMLDQAWNTPSPPLHERAAALATIYTSSPLAARLTLAAAPHLEGEARAVVSWVAAQLNAGQRALALIALDRETARRARALLERLDVLVADETGWTLSTTAAAAVLDRWLECVSSDFPHAELLDLLKSPFVLGDPTTRQDEVLAFELALRRAGVAQGSAEMERLARGEFGALPAWLGALLDARQAFSVTRAPLAVWLERLEDSLDRLSARTRLGADDAGAHVLETLAGLRHELADDAEKYGFADWRRWLNLTLESASFVDTGVTSPIVLTSLPAARGRAFDGVAVIGADARHLPVAPAAGLFSQATRAHLGLPTAADEAATATHDLVELLLQGPALLSWRAWNDDEPNPASPLVLRLQALHEAAWGHALTQQAVGIPPARADTAAPALCRRPAPTVLATQLPRRYSPSAYQSLLDCPYAFFARHVLGLRALDDADEALDKSDYGNALHRILQRFHDSDPPQERSAALEHLGAISDAEFAMAPAFTAAAWRSRWDKLQPAYVDAWLAWVAEGWRYEAAEREFATTVDVPALGEVKLLGRADRVDRRGDAVAVIDYKTGGATALKRKLLQPDEAVQLPFYAWLADAAAAYLPVNEAPISPLVLDGETDVAAISLRLVDLLEALARGTPLPAHGVDSVCRVCDARGLCRQGMWHA